MFKVGDRVWLVNPENNLENGPQTIQSITDNGIEVKSIRHSDRIFVGEASNFETWEQRAKRLGKLGEYHHNLIKKICTLSGLDGVATKINTQTQKQWVSVDWRSSFNGKYDYLPGDILQNLLDNMGGEIEDFIFSTAKIQFSADLFNWLEIKQIDELLEGFNPIFYRPNMTGAGNIGTRDRIEISRIVRGGLNDSDVFRLSTHFPKGNLVHISYRGVIEGKSLKKMLTLFNMELEDLEFMQNAIRFQNPF